MIKTERQEQKFLRNVLFTFDGQDDIEVGTLQFYDVHFPFKSMEKYNGYTVALSLDGTMEVYDEEGKVIWSGYPIEIEEWRKEKINDYPMQENKQRYAMEGKLYKGGNRIFVETKSELDELINNIPENTKVTIIIDF